MRRGTVDLEFTSSYFASCYTQWLTQTLPESAMVFVLWRLENKNSLGLALGKKLFENY